MSFIFQSTHRPVLSLTSTRSNVPDVSPDNFIHYSLGTKYPGRGDLAVQAFFLLTFPSINVQNKYVHIIVEIYLNIIQ